MRIPLGPQGDQASQSQGNQPLNNSLEETDAGSLATVKTDSLKDPDALAEGGRREKGMTEEDRWVNGITQLNRHE